MSRDRRDIVPALLEHFPELEGLSSEDVAGFLDAKCGTATDPTAKNSIVFDVWRKALAKAGHRDVWPYTAEQIATIKTRGEDLKTRMDALRATWASGKAPTPAEKSQRRAELEAIAVEKKFTAGWVEHVLEAEAKRPKANGDARRRP